MTEAAAERPAVRISFRLMATVLLGLAGVAFLGGRYVYFTYATYRPLALVHVPTTFRYRARVEVHDLKRLAALEPLLHALDPQGTRLAAIDGKLGVSAKSAAREVAFGVGEEPSDFVLVLGLQLQARTGLPAAKALCEVLSAEGERVQANEAGCRLGAAGLVAGTPDGAVVIASRAELVKDVLAQPDIGDRMGFSGPSVRGAAPAVAELAGEARTLAGALTMKRW